MFSVSKMVTRQRVSRNTALVAVAASLALLGACAQQQPPPPPAPVQTAPPAPAYVPPARG